MVETRRRVLTISAILILIGAFGIVAGIKVEKTDAKKETKKNRPIYSF